MSKIKAFCVIALILLLGCAGVNTNRLLLTAIDLPVDAVANQQHRQQTIAIRQMRLPEYLNEYHLIYQTDAQQVIVEKEQLWAQELSDNIKRVLQQNISQQLPNASVYSYPLGANLRPERIIDVQIIELIANQQNNTLKFIANWQVIQPKERNPLSHEFHQTYSLDDSSISDIISGYQRALADLSIAIIATI